MPYTKLQQTFQQRARVKYVTPKEFGKQYSISKAQVYNILKKPEMQEAVIKVRRKRNPSKYR